LPERDSLRVPKEGGFMRSVLWGCLAAALVSTCAPANAAWYEAKSKHFIVYADLNPRVLNDFSTRLERFDQAARLLLKMDDPPVGDGNRLTVYVLPTDADVQKLAGDRTGFIAGFYTGRATGSLAFIAKRNGGGGDLGAEGVLYHEYSHHLMMQQLSHAYPEWYVEGFAEYLSAPIFEHDGSVGIGAPPQRDWTLLASKALPNNVILSESYGDITKLPKELRQLVYERGWLLVHYLFMEPKRQGQLDRYLTAIANGTPAATAAQSAFGDLGQLEKELRAYSDSRTLKYFKISGARITPSQVDVRPLSAGASQAILLRGKLKFGLSPEETQTIASQLRQLESQFPGDLLVENTLSRAELETEHASAAEAAADRALKADPRNTEAMILKGDAVAARAKDVDGDQRKTLFDQARDIYIAANKVDTEDPQPLYDFYNSFLKEGLRPTGNAIAALHYASDLAPQDLGVRMNSAIAYLNEGKPTDARATLVPVAYSPHGGTASEMARRMLADIDGGNAKAALLELRHSPAPASAGH
jgi:hypothetical protein